jgi:hypothetical protein
MYNIAVRNAIYKYKEKNPEKIKEISNKACRKYYKANANKETKRVLEYYHWKKISKIFLNILLD